MAKYKFKGYTISRCGYHQPDHCVWWEAVDDRGRACFHGTTLREVEFKILDSEWEDKLKAKDREITAKDDVRLTIVTAYENVIADKDAEIAKLRTLTTHTDNSEAIAELQRRLKVAEEFATEMKQSTNSLVRSCGHQMILRLQGEGGNDGK